MNPEVKGAWVAALRSGEYTQGELWLRALKFEGSHFVSEEWCPLGVLADIVAKRYKAPLADEWSLEWKLGEGDGAYAMDGDREILSERFADLAGIDTQGIFYGGWWYDTYSWEWVKDFEQSHRPYIAASIVELNDTHGVPFDKIAEIIETAPETVWAVGTWS